MYFACLPLTVVMTPFGSMLKVVTIPVAAILSVRLLMGKSRMSFNYVHFTYFIYVLYTILQLGMYRSEVATTVTKDMTLGLLTFILISIRVYNDSEKELIESVWVLVGIICIVAAFTSKEVLSDAEERAVIKIFGFEEDQNQFCAYFIMPVIMCIKRISEKRKFTPLYFLMILLMLYAILKTGSRGGLIGIVIGAFAYIAVGIKDRKTRIAIYISSILAIIIVLFVIFPLLPETVTERYSIARVAEDKATGRFEIWKYLVNYTLKRPERIIRGSGVLSSFDILLDAPDKKFLNTVAHNTFVQVFSDQGIIGLILFFAVVVSCLLRPFNTEKAYSCGFFALMAFSMSLTFYVFKPYLNIMMMCAMSFAGQLPEDILKKQTERKKLE